MAIELGIARAARNLVTVHGKHAEHVALARAKNAQESNRGEVAGKWLQIAAAVRKLRGRRDR